MNIAKIGVKGDALKGDELADAISAMLDRTEAAKTLSQQRRGEVGRMQGYQRDVDLESAISEALDRQDVAKTLERQRRGEVGRMQGFVPPAKEELELSTQQNVSYPGREGVQVEELDPLDFDPNSLDEPAPKPASPIPGYGFSANIDTGTGGQPQAAPQPVPEAAPQTAPQAAPQPEGEAQGAPNAWHSIRGAARDVANIGTNNPITTGGLGLGALGGSAAIMAGADDERKDYATYDPRTGEPVLVINGRRVTASTSGMSPDKFRALWQDAPKDAQKGSDGAGMLAAAGAGLLAMTPWGRSGIRSIRNSLSGTSEYLKRVGQREFDRDLAKQATTGAQ